MEEKTKDFECCPPFDPISWDDKVFDWTDKKFVKEKVFTFFYMPVNFGGVIVRALKKIEMAGSKMEDWLCLSDHTSRWNMNIYLAVDKEIPGAKNVVLSGKFYSKVYEGHFRNTKDWSEDFEKRAKEKGLKIKEWYMWYTTCPKCAKKYGKNYVVIIAKVENQ